MQMVIMILQNMETVPRAIVKTKITHGEKIVGEYEELFLNEN